MVLLPTMWKSALPTASGSPAPRRPSFPTSALPSRPAVLPVLATLKTAGFGFGCGLAPAVATHTDAIAATATRRATSRFIGLPPGLGLSCPDQDARPARRFGAVGTVFAVLTCRTPRRTRPATARSPTAA